MSELSTYLEAKNNEIEYILNSIDAPSVNSCKTITDVVEEKFKIKSSFLKHYHHFISPETNTSSKHSFDLFGENKDWSYQRFDAALFGKKFTDKLYRFDNKIECKEQFVVTNCGMAAISSCLVALEKELIKINLIFPKDSYFESYWFSQKYINQDKGEDSFKVLYLDSISRFNPFLILDKILIDSLKCVVVDTTCWSDNSDILKRIVLKVSSYKIPLFFLRSHIKLDFLGTEMTRLGSVCSMSFSNDAFTKNILERARDFLSKVGGLPMVYTIPSFFADQKFKELSYKRTSRIKNFNNFLSKEIAKRWPGLVIGFDHNCFFSLESQEENILKRLFENKNSLSEELLKSSIPAYVSNGFGFDFIAIDSFYALGRDRYVLRIAGGDLPLSEYNKCASICIGWIDKYIGEEDE